MASRLPAPERRQQLLETALAIFARLGFRDASMNDIAEAAGVTKPVLYQHFTSKRELFIEVLTTLGVNLKDEVNQAVSSHEGPRARVEAGFTAWFRWVDQNRDGFSVLFDAETRRDPEFNELRVRSQRQMVDLVAGFIVVEGMDDDHRRLLAYGIVGMSETICRRWLEKEIDLTADELATQVSTFAWTGLRGAN